MAIAVSLILLLSVTSPAAAAVEKSVVAHVTVSTFINFTIIDYGNAGLKFGSLVPGSADNPEIAQGEDTGAILLKLGVDSNVDCLISTKATDFTSGSNKLPVDQITWNTASDAAGSNAMKYSYISLGTLSPGQSQGMWHWLNVPGKQTSGIYSASFFYQATKVT